MKIPAKESKILVQYWKMKPLKSIAFAKQILELHPRKKMQADVTCT